MNPAAWTKECIWEEEGWNLEAMDGDDVRCGGHQELPVEQQKTGG